MLSMAFISAPDTICGSTISPDKWVHFQRDFIFFLNSTYQQLCCENHLDMSLLRHFRRSHSQGGRQGSQSWSDHQEGWQCTPDDDDDSDDDDDDSDVYGNDGDDEDDD